MFIKTFTVPKCVLYLDTIKKFMNYLNNLNFFFYIIPKVTLIQSEQNGCHILCIREILNILLPDLHNILST